VVRVAGPDAAHFLDGLLPAKILGVGPEPIYTAFLTAHGRILVDAFIYPPASTEAPEWFIEVDAESVDILTKHLKKHKLRSKFAIERLKEPPIFVSHDTALDGSQASGPSAIEGLRAGGKDPRPGMASRYVVSESWAAELRQKLGDELPLDAYTNERMRNGLAEGQSELSSEASLPQESNIDLLGGIDFHKGCYLGQELTIRTHHTGVVRKRVLPVQLYDKDSESIEHRSELPPPGSNLSKVSTRKGRSTGKLLASGQSVGLALCRLEMMTDIQLTADATNFDPKEEYKVTWQNDQGQDQSVFVKPVVLDWLRNGIEANLRRKERKPAKKQDVDEDELDD